MTEGELAEIDKLMRARDLLPLGAKQEARDLVRLALADEVPGLVAEVRRLRAALRLVAGAAYDRDRYASGYEFFIETAEEALAMERTRP